MPRSVLGGRLCSPSRSLRPVPLARASSFDPLLAKGVEAAIERTEWTVDEPTALREDVHALLVAEALGDVA